MPADQPKPTAQHSGSESGTLPADGPSGITQTRVKAADTGVGELPADLLGRLRINIPGYRLLSVIGRGGQAIVFKAVQESTGKTVAVKLLKGGPITAPSTRERFDREVRALAAIDHPNIVGILDTGQTRHGHGFLVMNYIAGQSLKQLMEDAKLAPEFGLEPAAMLRLFKKICDAVNAAHMKGITHRDLSPSNVIVDEQGEPHIVDFGLARTAFDRFMNVDRREVTVTGQFLGKIAYASPEQAQGKSDQIDIRTDVYALGVILYQILTEGRFPYEVVGNIADVLHNIVSVKPTPPSQISVVALSTEEREPARLGGDSKTIVNPVIEAIVLKALEKNPADRYHCAGELGIDIENYLGGQPTMAKVAKSDFSSMRWTRPMSYAAAFLLLASGIAGGAYWWLRPSRSVEPLSVGSPIEAETSLSESSPSEAAIHKVAPANEPVEKAIATNGEKVAAKDNSRFDKPASSLNKPATQRTQSTESTKGAIDLLATARLPQTSCTQTPEGISIEKGKFIMRQAPSGEFDLHVSLTLKGKPTNLNERIDIVLWYKGARFAWVMGPRGNGSCGFQRVNGMGYMQNSSSEPFDLTPKRHDIVIHVRDAGLSVDLDGQTKCQLVTDYSDLTRWWIDAGNELEVQTAIPLVIHSAKLKVISGSASPASKVPRRPKKVATEDSKRG